MTTGSCSRTENSGVSCPVSRRQMSCFRSAQSRPMTAAKSEGWLGMISPRCTMDVRDMQIQAQRRQYGEPVDAAIPEYSLRARHTRGVESEFVSITCSPLHIRTPRVHVPLRFSRKIHEHQSQNGTPIKPLQQPIPPQGHRCRIETPTRRRACC